jgi:hypothetical protein
MQHSNSLNKFCLQLNEFCLLFQEEILRLEGTSGSSPSVHLALTFMETLILCPTVEAVQLSIRRDMAGARSFLVAADAVLRRIRLQRFQFSFEEPQFQTRFYLLGCAIEEFLRTRQSRELEGSERTCAVSQPG